MKTPITDAAAFDVEATGWDNTIEKNQWPNGDYVQSSLARRLELDRAALMEALEDLLNDGFDHGGPKIKAAQSALAAARANFPTP